MVQSKTYPRRSYIFRIGTDGKVAQDPRTGLPILAPQWDTWFQEATDNIVDTDEHANTLATLDPPSPPPPESEEATLTPLAPPVEQTEIVELRAQLAELRAKVIEQGDWIGQLLTSSQTPSYPEVEVDTIRELVKEDCSELITTYKEDVLRDVEFLTSMDPTQNMLDYTYLRDPQSRNYALLDPARQLATAEAVRLCGTHFFGTTKDTNFWTETVVTTGSATQAGEVLLASGSAADGAVQYQSVRRGRYLAGRANLFRGTLRLNDSGYANNIRRWGAFTTTAMAPKDGMWFQIDGTTMGVGYVKDGGTPTVVTATDKPLPKDTNCHYWEIWWTPSKIDFYIDNIKYHTVRADSTAWSYMGAFNATTQNINYGNTTDCRLDVRTATIHSFGTPVGLPTYRNITTGTTTVCKYAPGNLTRITNNNPTALSITATIYDNTSATGTKIGTLELKNGIGEYNYNCEFINGLTIVTSGSCDITVIYD